MFLGGHRKISLFTLQWLLNAFRRVGGWKNSRVFENRASKSGAAGDANRAVSSLKLKQIHVGDIRTPEKPSKTEILFVSKPPKSYSDPETYDGIDLSPIKLCAHTYFPIVDKFCYLGCFITRDCKDYVDDKNVNIRLSCHL